MKKNMLLLHLMEMIQLLEKIFMKLKNYFYLWPRNSFLIAKKFKLFISQMPMIIQAGSIKNEL
jgi:hypothetical protein